MASGAGYCSNFATIDLCNFPVEDAPHVHQITEDFNNLQSIFFGKFHFKLEYSCKFQIQITSSTYRAVSVLIHYLVPPTRAPGITILGLTASSMKRGILQQQVLNLLLET